MMMPQRSYSAGNQYRYGFNGKENDNEVKGEGNSLDFGYRIYDPRIGRWLSIDPLQGKYPFASPFNFVLNNPISFIDPDGMDIIIGESYANTKFWTTFLNKSFDNVVQFRIETDAEGIHRLKLDLIDGKSFKSEEQKKAYEYIKSIADNSSTNVKIASEGTSYSVQGDFWNISPDNYKTAEFYEQVAKTTKVDGFGLNSVGAIFIHFLAEQYSAQVDQKLTGEGKRNDYNYIKSHDFALNKGLEIFGHKWGDAIELPLGKVKVIDEDIIDSEGNYVTTMRHIHDFSGKEPKYSATPFERKGMKKGDKWTGPALNSNMSTDEYNKERRKYLQDNPIKQ